MALEVKNDNGEQDQEKFNKAFDEDFKKNPDIKKDFGELISGMRFDENLSKEENLKNAFDGKLGDLIKQHEKNLTPENRAELERLKKEVVNGAKDVESIVNTFKEIKQAINDRNGESAKGGQDMINDQAKKGDEKKSDALKDFIKNLKEAIKKSEEAQKDKQENIKNKKNEAKTEGDKYKNTTQLAEANDAIARIPEAQKSSVA